MRGGSRRISGFTLVAPNLNHPEMIVVGAPPPPYSITWLPFLGATSHKLRTRVRGLSRNESYRSRPRRVLVNMRALGRRDVEQGRAALLRNDRVDCRLAG